MLSTIPASRRSKTGLIFADGAENSDAKVLNAKTNQYSTLDHHANAYRAFRGNPVRFVDPLGLAALPGYPNIDVPAPGLWSDELLKIIAAAEAANKKFPNWNRGTYECSEMASDLKDALDKAGPWKYWEFQIIGAESGVHREVDRAGGAWRHFVVAVTPRAIYRPLGNDPATGDTWPWENVNNPMEPVILDPFHKDNAGLNAARSVNVQTFAEFAKDFPYWTTNETGKLFPYNPPPRTTAPTGGPKAKPPPPPIGSKLWFFEFSQLFSSPTVPLGPIVPW